jgi:hypothetical protein
MRSSSWAADRGAQRVRPWVTGDNDAARALYARQRFHCTGERKPLRSDPSFFEFLMVDNRQRSRPRLMGQTRAVSTFGAHLRWTWALGLGYAASVATHVWLSAHRS